MATHHYIDESIAPSPKVGFIEEIKLLRDLIHYTISLNIITKSGVWTIQMIIPCRLIGANSYFDLIIQVCDLPESIDILEDPK